MELNIDKEFSELWPALDESELADLEKSLLADGCLSPIILWANHEDTILDGEHRYRLCSKHNIPFKTKVLRLETREDAKAWILRFQTGRRNITPSQRAWAAAQLASLERGRPNKSATVADLSQEEAAEEKGVSVRQVQRAAKVLHDGAPELKAAVRDGVVPVNVAAEVAELPKAEQKKLVKAGPAAVKEAAKEHKAEKKIKGGSAFPFGANAIPEDEPDGDGTADLAALQRPYDEMLNAITQLKKTWKLVADDERNGVYAIDKRQRVLSVLDELRPPIAQARPHALCNFCGGKGCKKCQNCGWWPRSVVEGMTK